MSIFIDILCITLKDPITREEPAEELVNVVKGVHLVA